MSWIVRGYQRTAFLALLGVLALVSLVWNFAALLLHPALGERAGGRIGRSGIAHGYRLFWTLASASGLIRLQVGDLDRLAGEQGLIIAANHPTLLDAVMLASRLPRAACIMKAELMRNVFLGAGARLARYIRNDSPLGIVRHAVATLKAGGQLIIFPEGTRTEAHPVDPFRPGIGLIAKLARAPVQTVFIDTASPYLRKGWPVWRTPPFPIVIHVRLGARFPPEADHAALLRRLELYFAQALGSSPPASLRVG